MGYVITATSDSGERFFFGGFEGSDTPKSADEMTYWYRKLDAPEVYFYTDLAEVTTETMLIARSDIANAIGLPEKEINSGLLHIRVEDTLAVMRGQ
jgi:hypothetical protein